MLTNDFIEEVIAPKSQKENEDMISREFNGIESVAEFREMEEEIEQVMEMEE